MLSGFILIFANLGQRKPGTLSAYSVFNKNNEKLLGTFDLDSVERSFLHRNIDPNSFLYFSLFLFKWSCGCKQ